MITLINLVKQTSLLPQCMVRQGRLFLEIQLFIAYLGKMQQVPCIVVSTTRYDDSALFQLCMFHDVVKHRLGQLTGIDKPDRIPLAALLDGG